MNSLDLPAPPAATRVVVAMSGGVDSSVAAALLQSEGYDVVGITLKLYDGQGTRRGACCAGRDIDDARRVAERLGIPHYVLDYEERFRRQVIVPFAEGYARGETPIPCASCNDAVKFTDLLATARDLGASALATGHYCATRALPDGRRALHRGADPSRDQSYFLGGTTPAQLAFLRFPLGDLPKTRVRELARELGLATADKPDSQDICFVPDGRYAGLVAKLLPEAARPGDIVDEAGTVLGRHDGITRFTVGQRRGLGLGGRGRDDGEPLYVLRLDARQGRVVVGPRAALAMSRLTLRGVNWLGDGPLPAALDLHVRTRSTRPPVPARLVAAAGPASVLFPAGDTAVSPGQACVFYDGDGDGARVLGGGTVAAWAGADAPEAVPAEAALAS